MGDGGEQGEISQAEVRHDGPEERDEPYGFQFHGGRVQRYCHGSRFRDARWGTFYPAPMMVIISQTCFIC